MFVSIVIPVYNEEKYLGKCLESLCHLETKHDFEVIIVDNCSKDRSAEIARQFTSRLHLRIVKESKKGRGAARATGCLAAHGKIIFSTDADTQFPANWLDVMCKPFSNPEVAATTGYCAFTGLPKLNGFLLKHIQLLNTILILPMLGAWPLSGFNSAFRSTIYLKTPGYDRENNGMEDLSLTKEIAKFGKICFVSQSCVLQSGRRFSKGLIRGSLDYTRPLLAEIFNQKKIPELSDVT